MITNENAADFTALLAAGLGERIPRLKACTALAPRPAASPQLPSPIEARMSAAEVIAVLQVSKSTFQRLRRDDPTFPPPEQLTERRLGWKPSVIEEWLLTRQKAR